MNTLSVLLGWSIVWGLPLALCMWLFYRRSRRQHPRNEPMPGRMPHPERLALHVGNTSEFRRLAR